MEWIRSRALSSLTSLALHPGVVSAGASGALFGVIGAFLVFAHRQDDEGFKHPLRVLGLCTWVFVGFNLLASVDPIVDNAAHVGGLLAGMLAGFLLREAAGIDSGIARVAWQRMVAATGVFLVAYVAVHAQYWSSDRSLFWHHTERGRAAWYYLDYERMKAGYTAALAIDPEAGFAYGQRGIANYELGNLEQAASDLSRAVAAEDAEGVHWYHRGLVRYTDGDLRGARGDLRRAQATSPEDEDLARMLALVEGDHAFETLLWEDAVGFYDRALDEVREWNAYALGRRGRAHHLLGHDDEALEDLTCAREAAPENEEVERWFRLLEDRP